LMNGKDKWKWLGPNILWRYNIYLGFSLDMVLWKIRDIVKLMLTALST
jgi:hypothetical protein